MKKIILCMAIAALVAGVSSCRKSYGLGSGDAELNAKMDQMQQEQEKAEKEAAQAYDNNIAAGKKFADDAMKQDSELKKTASGLVYKMITPGTGANFKETDQISVNYTGKHLNGEVFDSNSLHGGAPAQFAPSGVVPGFKEMLLMMKPGAKAVCYIPSELGYGKTGTPDGKIKPGEMLEFEIETIGLAK